MRIVVIVLLAWFAVTAIVMPLLVPQKGVDIWTTDDLGEISDALRAPIDFTLSITDFMSGFVEGFGPTDGENPTWIESAFGSAGEWLAGVIRNIAEFFGG